jgi:diaminopimelate epimerase
MHGLGNDFVIIEKTSELKSLDLSLLAKKISNRYTGIGCDQVILYEATDLNAYNMSIYNQDGQEAEACGNGTRCLAKFIGKQASIINVMGRILNCTLLDDGRVTVNMGSVSFNKPWMPEISEIWKISSLYKLEPKEIICADIGNPHLIIFNSDLSIEDQKLLGQTFEHNKLFPHGVNVNFAKINNNNIDLIVWERGDGFTLACGSGACATFAAAKKLGFVNDKAVVNFKLGSLEMSSFDESVLMTGPAEVVAKGSYQYD